MTEFVLESSAPHTALSHLALYGLAAILDDAGHRITLSWTTGMDPRPVIHSDLEPNQIGETVHAHAARRAENGWLHEDFDVGARTVALMSPRISKLSESDWPRLQRRRHEALDALTQDGSRLDLRLIAALGEPCYWSKTPKREIRQDDAASRWEMQPRNQGSEFVKSRLRPLATHVSSRSSRQIVNGLTGASTVDSLGKGRTATGLAPLGPTDDALAWCGLWGISQLPTTHRFGGRSRTTGHQGPATGGTMTLPAWTRPWTLGRLRTLLGCPQLATFANPESSDLDRDIARAWLAERHIVAAVRFPIHRYGTDQAPERRTQHGTILSTQPPAHDEPETNSSHIRHNRGQQAP